MDIEGDVDGTGSDVRRAPLAIGQFALTYLRKQKDVYLQSLAEDYDIDPPLPLAFSGGVDLLHRVSERTDLLIPGRYTFNQRDTRLQYLGIGPHIIRAGVGVRIRLN